MSVVVSGLLSRAKAFWPMLAGIICARTALIVACYGSYASTDDGIFTDGSMFVTCALFIVALLIFSRSRRELGATAVQWIMVGSIIVAAGASMALSLLDSADQTLVATAFALSIASTLALSLCMFYWMLLRAKVKKVRARRCGRSVGCSARRPAGPRKANWATMSAIPMMFCARVGRNESR